MVRPSQPSLEGVVYIACACARFGPPHSASRLPSLLAVYHVKLETSQFQQLYEPQPRYRHFAGALGGECIIFAGRTTDFEKNKEVLSFTIEIFDQYFEQWRELKTTGIPPKGLYGGGHCASPSGDLYVYGGFDESSRRGGLYELSSLKWRQLSEETSSATGPMKKVGSRMVCFNKKKIAVIGGYGPPSAPLQLGATFIKDKCSTHGNGWTNEILTFSIDECK